MSIPVDDQVKLDVAQNKIDAILTSIQTHQQNKKTVTKKYEQAWPKRQAGTLYKIDVYDGPQGQGYILSFYAFVNGKTYKKQYHIGPETERTIATEWTEEV